MIAAVPFMLVFRFLHIVAGVLWVGSAFLFVGFIGPSAGEVGPSAGPLLAAAVKKRKVVKVITGLGAVTRSALTGAASGDRAAVRRAGASWEDRPDPAAPGRRRDDDGALLVIGMGPSERSISRSSGRERVRSVSGPSPRRS